MPSPKTFKSRKHKKNDCKPKPPADFVCDSKCFKDKCQANKSDPLFADEVEVKSPPLPLCVTPVEPVVPVDDVVLFEYRRYVPDYKILSPPDSTFLVARHFVFYRNLGNFTTVRGEVDIKFVNMAGKPTIYTGPVTFSFNPPLHGTQMSGVTLGFLKLVCGDDIICDPVASTTDDGYAIQLGFNIAKWKFCKTLRLVYNVTFSRATPTLGSP